MGQGVCGKTPRTRIITFVALGGEGKTSLVAKWAADLAAQGWPGCDAAFAWSFYSQGTRDQVAASSDIFLKEALTFFGDDEDKEFAASNVGPYEKGQRLARVVGRRRNLLILDGLEPLQYAPTSPTAGELKDQGVAALLKGLATHSTGLCVVTTRYAVPDLRAFMGRTAREVKLTRLSREAGVALLKRLGVRGTQTEFEKLEEADTEEQGGHAFRAMDAYVRSFEREGEKGRRALALLRLLGLFDRPATADCLNALLQAPAIPGLTEALVDLTEPQLNVVISRLESAGLVTTSANDSTIPHSSLRIHYSLDAHPLLREYFAQRLSEEQPEAWRAAHRRIYEHLCASTHEGEQPTLEDLQPLYQAVGHGCQAGLQQAACEEVYHDRILRNTGSNGFYSMNQIGAFGSDLGAIACFFQTPWHHVSPALTAVAQAWLLNEAAFRLRALGRLTESIEPMRAGLEMRVKHENWKQAARSASNLSELALTLGDVAAAVQDAERAVTYADRSGDAFQQIGKRTTHADALHQAGRWTEAEARFREASDLQAKD